MRKMGLVSRALALALGLIVLAGCSSGAPAPATQAPTKPAKPKVLHWYATDNPTSFDPAMTSDVNTMEAIIWQVYSGLVSYDEKGNVQPEIAASWKVSDDGKTYTFTLKDGVKFHSGRAVTPEDFKWSMLRAANPALSSPVADSYLDDIVGFAKFFGAQSAANAPVSKLTASAKAKADEVKAGKAQQSELDDLNKQLDAAKKKAEADVKAAYEELQKNPGIDTPDAKTIVFHIDAPKPYFLVKLTYPTAFVVDKDKAPFDKPIATSPDNIKQAIGTGPFMLTGFVDNSSISVQRWDGFYGQKAKVDSVDMQIIKDELPNYAKYKSGELDIAGVPTSEYKRIKADTSGEGKEMKEYSYASVGYFAMNEGKYEPFKNAKVRQAFNFALDKEAMIDVVYQGSVFSAYGILPSGIPGGNADKIKKLSYDPARAKTLAKEAGYDETHPLPEMTITYRPGETTQKAAEFYQQQFQAALPIKVKLQPMEWGQLLNETRKKNTLDAFSLGWTADYLDPQDFLSLLLACQAPYNRYGYCNKSVDDVLAKADVAPPGDARLAMYANAEQMIVDDGAWIPINFGKRIRLIKPYVSGFRHNAMGVMPLNTVDLADH